MTDMSQDLAQYKAIFTSCIIKTASGKLLLQKRPKEFKRFGGYLSAFGGRVEAGETPKQAILRELQEELGAAAHDTDIIELGAVTEEATNHEELIYQYFWHDRQGLITGCYEGGPAYFDSATEVLEQDNLMEDVVWNLKICLQRGLL